MTVKLLMRTLKLYGYHVLLLFLGFGIAARYAFGDHGQALYNLMDFFFAAGPARAIRDALLLVYRPPLLDIVPLYIIFLVLSPIAIYLAARIGWKFVLCGGVVLWLLAQFGMREASYAFLALHFGLQIPLHEMGAFNLWAWQFMWVMGMWFGVRWAKNDLPVESWAQRTWIPAAIVATLLCALRYKQIFGLDLTHYAVFLDKWHFGIVRLLNFSAIAMLLIRFRPVMNALTVRPLVLMGQSSLQVFCTHFVFCFIGIAMMGDGQRLYGWKQAALIVVTFAALLAVARYNARTIASPKSDKTEKQRRPVHPVVAS
jgi:hypothetical protein